MKVDRGRVKVGFIITDRYEKWNIGDFFLERYQKNCRYDNIEFVVIHSLKEELPNDEELKRYLGFVISGSRYSVNNELGWMFKLEQFIRKLYQLTETERPKLFGTCFGHQLIAKALGGTVDNNKHGQFILGSEQVKVNESLYNQGYFSKLFKEKAFRIMESHGEEVIKIPSGAICSGSSETCKNEILMYGDHILSTQGHPEFTEDLMRNIIIPSKKNLNERQIEKGFQTISLAETDIMVQLVIEFLMS